VILGYRFSARIRIFNFLGDAGAEEASMSRSQRSTASYPDVIAAAQRDYELSGLGYRQLSKKHGIPRSTIAYLATSQWAKPGRRELDSPPGYPAAHDVSPETRGVVSNISPPTGGRLTDVTANRAPGRPRKNPQADEGLGIESPSSAEHPTIPPSLPSAQSDGRSPSPADVLSQLKGPGATDAQSATILNFPQSDLPPRQHHSVPRLLPIAKCDEKAIPHATLRATRAAMTLRQIEQAEAYERLLHRYMHLLNVYLEPQRFMDLAGLDENAKALKAEAMRKMALGVLLPAKGDTLTGTIKILTSAIEQIITLKRKLVGLEKANGGMGGFPSPPGSLDDDDGDRRRRNLSSLTTAELRVVTQGMEILDRHQHEMKDAPMPPPPEPLDDLFEPDGSDTEVEPDGPGIQPR
jgi:hypothetical protein